MAAEPIKFKKRFRPQRVVIEQEDGASYAFETVALTRSVEREIKETLERVAAFDGDTTDEEALDIVLESIDKMIVPEKGKKTLASKVLRDRWKAEDIESMDIIDFFNELVVKRRPT